MTYCTCVGQLSLNYGNSSFSGYWTKIVKSSGLIIKHWIMFFDWPYYWWESGLSRAINLKCPVKITSLIFNDDFINYFNTTIEILHWQCIEATVIKSMIYHCYLTDILQSSIKHGLAAIMSRFPLKYLV